MKKPILLHICCAPDATHPIEKLSREFDVSGYFYNPNIQPFSEYSKRVRDTEYTASSLGVSLYKGDYDVKRWSTLTTGLERELEGGERCTICYRMRLERTARFARDMGFPWFTTTLTISPHKPSHIIFREGREAAVKYGVNFFEVDFKKGDGFKRSVEISKRLGLYRQDYCGCIHSLEQRLAIKEEKLAALRHDVQTCDRCDFTKEGRVLPSGAAKSRIMVIGQAPGKHEIVTSKPFSGAAGRRLFDWFAQIGVEEDAIRNLAYITATVKCYPGRLPQRKTDNCPSSIQIRHCTPFLEREIKIVRPQLLIPVGRLAVHQVIGPARLSEVVGGRFRRSVFDHFCTIVPLPHPSGANPWSFKNPERLHRALSLLKEELAGG